MSPAAILFDFDGVLIESEYAGNKQIAEFLTAAGHPTTLDQSMANFMGYSGAEFHRRLETWIGGPLPTDWSSARLAEDERALDEGIAEVAGAVAFVRALPPMLPRAVVSSSSTHWLYRHLDHLDLASAFGEHVYSGAAHVTRGKPAPDIYLYAAEKLGVPIADCAIIEDSPVGVTGAVASGATVVGLAAGQHCRDGHAAALRERGAHHVAHDFAEVAALLSL